MIFYIDKPYQLFFHKQFQFGVLLVFLFWLSACSDAPKIKPNKKLLFSEEVNHSIKDQAKSKAIDRYFSMLFKNKVFNGNVLVAQKGRVIFEKSYGYSDIRTKDSLKLNSVFQLGSVSKQFTAVAILQLYEKGRLDLKDSIQKFFPEFPYKGITIHQLLCHRSGLLNYIYYCDALPIDKSIPLSNSGVLKCLSDSCPRPYFSPNQRFDYSNTGYLVLASVVEKVSGMAFEDYMKQYVFEPLNMKDSYVYNHNKPFKSRNVVKGYEYGRVEANPDFLDGVVGDKGVYSTVHDLYLWDQGLYSNTIISRPILNLAFRAYGKKLNSKKNYGYGWRIYYTQDSTRILYHGGWWHGFQSLLIRSEKDSSTVVVLKNKKNKVLIDQERILRILYSKYE